MVQEIKSYTTSCDVCGRVKDQPTAIAGYSHSGWERVECLDLCFVCYHTYIEELKKLVSVQQSKAILRKLVQDTPKQETNTVAALVYSNLDVGASKNTGYVEEKGCKDENK